MVRFELILNYENEPSPLLTEFNKLCLFEIPTLMFSYSNVIPFHQLTNSIVSLKFITLLFQYIVSLTGYNNIYIRNDKSIERFIGRAKHDHNEHRSYTFIQEV